MIASSVAVRCRDGRSRRSCGRCGRGKCERVRECVVATGTKSSRRSRGNSVSATGRFGGGGGGAAAGGLGRVKVAGAAPMDRTALGGAATAETRGCGLADSAAPQRRHAIQPAGTRLRQLGQRFTGLWVP